jgi:signal transduction histidine kinase
MPGDFAAGVTVPPGRNLYERSDFATYRIVLALEEGVIYGISGYSAPQAMTLWVNGDVVFSAGTPSCSIDGMQGSISHLTAFFKAEAGYTEIIIHRSSFLHLQLGSLEPLHLGELSLIISMNNLAYINTSISIGVLLVAVVFFFGIFIYLKDYRYSMWISLFCLMIALRTFARDYVLIANFFPQMGWQSIHRLGMVGTLGFSAFGALYLNTFFSANAKHKGVSRLISAATAIIFIPFTLFYLIAPSTVYTQMPFHILFHFIGMIMPVIALINAMWIMANDPEKRKIEHGLIMVASAFTFVFGLLEVYFVMFTFNPHTNQVLIGALIFIFICAAAVAINYHRTEFTAKETEMRLAAENAALDRIARMKSEFLANISHEIKTPLTIISGNVQQAAELYEKTGREDREIISSLTDAKDEIMRLARLTQNSLWIASMQENQEQMQILDTSRLITGSAELHRHVIEKNGNTFNVKVGGNLPRILGNADQMIQVMANLLSNANTHTKDGIITVDAHAKDGFIAVTVTDSGTGINAEMLPHIFERGATVGGTGIGLSISKEIIKIHGGKIEVSSEYGKGTQAMFRLPVHSKGKGADDV